MTALADEHRKVLDELKLLVGDELKSVSYKWLARQYDLPATLAKQLLFAFTEEARGSAAATYLVAGWEKGTADENNAPASSRSHVVRLVPASRLAEARAALDPVTAVHVYSVAPCQPKDPADVWNADAAQTAELFSGLLRGEANPLADNRCSAVAGPAVKWAGRLPGGKGAPPTTAAPPAQAAPPGLLRVDPTEPPAVAGGKAHVAAAAKPMKKKPAGSGGGGGVVAQIKAAAAAAKPKPEPLDEDDGGPPVRGRAPAGAARRAILSDSSDEEDGAAEPSAAPSPSPAPSSKRPTPPPGAVKAGAVAGAKKRRVTRTVINDKGEEVTEVVMEDVPEGAGGGGGGGGTASPSPAKAAAKAQPKPAAGGAGAAKKKPSPAAAGKKGGKGQTSLMGFFGKK